MQWNACKSSEIKNPFGCRDVFIIKTLTSWIFKNAARCWGSQGSQGGAVSFLAPSHGAEEQNKPGTDFRTPKAFLWTDAGMNTHEIPQEGTACCKPSLGAKWVQLPVQFHCRGLDLASLALCLVLFYFQKPSAVRTVPVHTEFRCDFPSDTAIIPSFF